MSEDKKFHKSIESQDQESKQKAWENIKAQIDYDEKVSTSISFNDGETIVLGKRRNLILLGCFLLMFIALLIGGLYLILSHPHKDIDAPIIEDPSNNVIETPPEEDIRYSYTAADYTDRYIEKTLKEISGQNSCKILYFDWYAETEECCTIIAEGNNSNQVVYYLETIVDPNTGYSVQLGITDNKTQVDIYAKYDICDQIEQIDQVSVKWTGDLFISYATFEYDGYIYYLEIQDIEKSEDILDYVRELLLK